jgi:hypothetical protein
MRSLPTLLAQADTNPCTPGGDSGINLLNCLRLSDNTPVYTRYNNFSDLVTIVVNNLILVGSIIFFFMIIYGGYLYIAKGKKGVDDARGIWTRAVVGIIVMISAYWIVQIIQFMTGARFLF